MKTRFLRRLMPLALLLTACGLYRAAAARPDASIAVERQEPWTISPRYDDPRVATDEQLHQVLQRLMPPAGAPNTNTLVHALRLWGPAADFGSDAIASGARMREYYLDDHQFQKLAGADAPPLWSIERDGVRARPWEAWDKDRDTGSVHTDDLLATLAEIGTPLNQRVITRSGPTTVGTLLQDTMRRFHREQHEYEWSAISYARYLFPTTEWRNRWGQKITVADVVDELLAQPYSNGVCGGTHRLEALVVLYRADEQARVLSRHERKKIVARLAEVSRLLVAAQHADGYWTRRWLSGRPPATNAKTDLYERILLTGHHLEWLALAPPEVQPPRETIVRAGQWLVRAMLEIDPQTLASHYGPCSHAGRALCLWRSQEPYIAWKAGRNES